MMVKSNIHSATPTEKNNNQVAQSAKLGTTRHTHSCEAMAAPASSSVEHATMVECFKRLIDGVSVDPLVVANAQASTTKTGQQSVATQQR